MGGRSDCRPGSGSHHRIEQRPQRGKNSGHIRGGRRSHGKIAGHGRRRSHIADLEPRQRHGALPACGPHRLDQGRNLPPGRQGRGHGRQRSADPHLGYYLRGQPAELPEQPQAIRALVYSPDGKFLASAGFDDKVRLYTSDGRLPRELDGPGSDLTALAFSPDGAQLAAAGRAGTIRLWNTATGTTTVEIQASPRRICALAYSPGGSQLAAAGDDRAIRIFDPVSGKVLTALPQRPGKIRALEFCGEKLLAAGDTDNAIRLWNLSTKAEENRLRRSYRHRSRAGLQSANRNADFRQFRHHRPRLENNRQARGDFATII